MGAPRIKIAYILTPITFGGAERVSFNFLRNIDRKRFDIHPILLTRPWEREPYFSTELPGMGFAYDTVPVAIKANRDPLRVLRVAWRLYSILKQGGFDLVHTHGYFADICGLPPARLLGINSLSTCHGYIANDFKMKIYNMIDKYFLRLCHTVIAVSEDIKNELIRSKLKSTRIEVISNAVEPKFDENELKIRRYEKRRILNIKEEEHVVGYLGRLSVEKGLVYLIDAALDLRNTSTPIKMLIVGEGPEREALDQRIRNKGLEKIVIFAGFQQDTENWLSAMDIFVLPSLTEGTPMALLEAMAVGIPVIATAVGGVPKVLTDGINGMIVQPGDSKAISEKIKLLINNFELKNLLRSKAIDIIKAKYSISSWCKTVEHRYNFVYNAMNVSFENDSCNF